MFFEGNLWLKRNSEIWVWKRRRTWWRRCSVVYSCRVPFWGWIKLGHKQGDVFVFLLCNCMEEIKMFGGIFFFNLLMVFW